LRVNELSKRKLCEMKFFSKKAEEPGTVAPEQTQEQLEKDVTPSQIEHGPATAHIDPEIEKRVRRKLDMNLIPLVSALYLRTYQHARPRPSRL
jgi:hypothetical protein